MNRTYITGLLVHGVFRLALVAALAANLQGQVVGVRHRVGSQHAFLILRNQAGATMAAGELTQVPDGDTVKERLIFHFRDGSIDDESTVYSQQQTFRLISDRHIQKGPSFPHPCDVTIDMPSQQVTVLDLSKNDEAARTEHMDLPPDLANGIFFTLLMNLQADAAGIELPYLSDSLKPRMVKLAVTPGPKEHFRIAGRRYEAVKYDLKVELGGVAGIVAPMIGKQPADIHVWIAGGSAPTIVRVDSALYSEGPVWSIRPASPQW